MRGTTLALFREWDARIAMQDATVVRDTVVIGASAGGIEALKRLLAVFPADLPATVLVTVHIGANSQSALARILDLSTPLTVQFAEEGMQTRLGCVYLAPPDRHLVVADGHVSLLRGPLENRARPAIDALFRSAAVHRRSRVIGAVLTGLLDDGSAGLVAIKRCGGIALVQHPDDASSNSMPQNAANALGPLLDGAYPIEELGRRIVHMVGKPVRDPEAVPAALALENEISEHLETPRDRLNEIGSLVALTCPACSGPLVKVDDPSIDRYRCYVGHAFSAHALLADQQDRVERALWAAMRSLEERGNTLLTLARSSHASGHPRGAMPLEREAAQLQTHAQTLRAILLAHRAPTEDEPEAL